MKSPSRRHAQNALINILVFPGLGSLRSERWLAGLGQLVLVITGSTMILIWFFKEMSQYYGLMFGDVKPESLGWIGETGGALFAGSWIWAVITSISLFREASKPDPVPPQIAPMSKLKPVDPKIRSALATLPDWRLKGVLISRTYEFADFLEAMKFVNTVAELAEQAQHHPDIDVRWNKVTLALTTHDAGGLTDKDFDMARQCDALLLG